MATTGQQLIDSILNILNEASNSEAPQYDSNNANAPTYTSTQGLVNAVNKFTGRICTTFYGWQDTGSMTPGSGAAYTALSGLSTSAGGTVWCPLAVSYNGQALYQTDYSHLRMNYPTLQTDAPGTPKFFCRDAQYNIVMAPKPSGGVIQVQGWAVPQSITTATASLGANLNWIQDEFVSSITYGCAAEIARQNSEDFLLSNKVAEWESEFYRMWEIIYGKLDLGQRSYFTPPPNIPENEAQLAS